MSFIKSSDNFRTRLAQIAIAVPVFFLMASCGGKKSMLAGSWRGTKVENEEMERFYKNSQQYIDTMGGSKNPMVNLELYGATNMDSLRHEMQLQLDSAKAMQQRGLNNTFFSFAKNGMVYISFNGSIDTSKWTIENDKDLIIEEMIGKDKGTKTKMVILNLTEQELKLRLTQDSAVSTVTLLRTTMTSDEIVKQSAADAGKMRASQQEEPASPAPAAQQNEGKKQTN